MVKTDWDPETYGRFRGLRLRPAMDLLAQVPPLPEGAVVDLGCGDGAAAAALRARFPDRRLVGVDASPAMLARAEGYDAVAEADIAAWEPDSPVALLFSNAALHWLPDHATLMPRLAGMLVPGGCLAVQMPRQQLAVSHALMRRLAGAMFPYKFDFHDWQPQVGELATYQRLLQPQGEVSVWQSVYLQRLDPVAEGHPVRHFTQSTAMRPFVEEMTSGEQARFVAAYDAKLGEAYPPEADGSVLFPFRRLFFVLTRGD